MPSILKLIIMENGKVLITGGAGFIGSHLVDALLGQNWEVSVLDNCSAGDKICPLALKNIQFIKGDVRDLNLVLRAAENCDAIIHLAAVVGVDAVIARQTETIETETIGTQNIVKAAKLNRVKKIIYSSSSAVYGKVRDRFNREDDSLDLVNAYAVAKRLNEQYLGSLTLEEGISTNCLRFFNVYGGRQDSRMVVPRFFEQAINNQPIEVFGDGNQTRDFTHIDDVVEAITTLLSSHSVNGVFNISRGIETTIQELAELIKKVTNSDSKISNLIFPIKRKLFKVDRRVGSAEKLFKHIGTKPSIFLQEGLETYFSKMINRIENSTQI
ncbi:MAG: NAD-dependent epimerase/dehydratase family protein [Saprospiraceae bacterium]